MSHSGLFRTALLHKAVLISFRLELSLLLDVLPVFIAALVQ